MDPCVPLRGRQGDPGELGNRQQASSGRGVPEEIQGVKHKSPFRT